MWTNSRRIILFALAFAYFMGKLLADDPFSEVTIEKPFDRYLKSDRLLMEVTGAKVINEKGGRKVLLAVASTVLKNSSPVERLRAEKVCRVKALAAMVAEQKGVMVCHTETLNDQTTIIIDDKGESATSVSELLQTTKTKVEGITKDMPIVGRWKSKVGDIFYLAIGVVLSEDGEVILLDQPK
jgi:hypothetical protein